MVKQDVGKNAFGRPSVVLICQCAKLGLPKELKLLALLSFFMVLLINSGKHRRLKVHLCEEVCRGCRMTEWIQLPSDLRFDPELVSQKVMGHLKVAKNVGVVRAGFID